MEKLTSINLKSIVAKINELIELVIDNSKKPDNSGLIKRIEALEGVPQYKYDDKHIKDRVTELENKPVPKQKEFDDSVIMLAIGEIRESLSSLDKRIDFVRRTYSEKWEQAEFERAKFQKVIGEQISKIETPQDVDLSDVERRIDKLELIEHKAYDDSAIKKSIAEIKKAIPQPISLVGIESRLKKLEEKPSNFYNDKPITKEIESIKNELSKIKKSVNDILE